MATIDVIELGFECCEVHNFKKTIKENCMYVNSHLDTERPQGKNWHSRKTKMTQRIALIKGLNRNPMGPQGKDLIKMKTKSAFD